jgi:hypothetical protein
VRAAACRWRHRRGKRRPRRYRHAPTLLPVSMRSCCQKTKRKPMILLPEDEAKAHDGAHGVVRPGVAVEHLRAEFLSLLDVDEAVLLLIFRRFAKRKAIHLRYAARLCVSWRKQKTGLTVPPAGFLIKVQESSIYLVRQAHCEDSPVTACQRNPRPPVPNKHPLSLRVESTGTSKPNVV